MDREDLHIGDYLSYESAGRGRLVGKVKSIAGYQALVWLVDGTPMEIRVSIKDATKVTEEEAILAALKGFVNVQL